MSVGIVDTTVIFHIFRRNPDALAWYAAQTAKLSITPITWLETIYGARGGKAGQAAQIALLNQFELLYLRRADWKWTMRQLRQYRLSHGVATNDCLIASVAHRLQIPLYTDNVKHMQVILPSQLVVKPY